MHEYVHHQLHAIVPLLDALELQQEPLALIFPRKGPLDTGSERMYGGVAQPLPPALGVLAVAGKHISQCVPKWRKICTRSIFSWDTQTRKSPSTDRFSWKNMS